MSDFGDGWIELPNGDGIHRDDLRPCGGCGGTVFRITGGPIAQRRAYCGRCVKPKAGERIVGTIDMRTGRVTAGGRG